jgi:hypothetical protein
MGFVSVQNFDLEACFLVLSVVIFAKAVEKQVFFVYSN